MELSMDYVIDALEGFPIQIPSDFDTAKPLVRVELFAGQDPEHDVLYIAEEPILNTKGCFLVAPAPGTPLPNLTSESFFVEGLGVAAALNLITRHIGRIERCLDEMRSQYYEHHDLTGFCQLFANCIGNPIIAYDDAILPIAQSVFPRDFAIATFGAASMSGEYVFEEIPKWGRDGSPYSIPTEGFDCASAFRTYTHDKSMSTVMCGVVVNGETRGFLEIFQVNKAITAGEMRMLEEACRIVALPYPFEENRFIASRLEGRTIQQDLTDAWLSALRWRATDPVFVVVVSLPPAYSESMHNMDRAMRVLRSIVPESICLQMGQAPVLVANSRFTSRDRVVATVANFLKDTNTEYHLGSSEMLAGIGSLHEGYAHAQFAAQFAEQHVEGSAIVYFEDCQFAYFSELCALDENKELVLDQAVSRMFADDQATGTENTFTTKAYIETGFNLNATAKTVSVHRNTVAYRLKHIADCYGIDLSTPIDDPNLVFRILLSCKILLGDS